MSEEAIALLKKALTLPVKERAELASSLIDSLDSSTDENVEAAWQEEIARRIETLRSGGRERFPGKKFARRRTRSFMGKPIGISI